MDALGEIFVSSDNYDVEYESIVELCAIDDYLKSRIVVSRKGEESVVGHVLPVDVVLGFRKFSVGGALVTVQTNLDFDDYCEDLSIYTDQSGSSTVPREGAIVRGMRKTPEKASVVAVDLPTTTNTTKRLPREEVIDEFDKVVSVLATEMARLEEIDEARWLFGLNDSMVYHSFKENLKPTLRKAFQGLEPEELYTEMMKCATIAANRRFDGNTTREEKKEARRDPPAKKSPLEVAASFLEKTLLDQADTALDLVDENEGYVTRALVKYARGLDKEARKLMLKCTPSRGEAALDAAVWFCRRNMPNCGRQALELARRAEERAMSVASKRNDQRRANQTPRSIRFQTGYVDAYLDYLTTSDSADRKAREAVVLADNDEDRGQAWLLAAMINQRDNVAAERALALLMKPPLWLFLRVSTLSATLRACSLYPSESEAWRAAGTVLLESGDYYRAETMLAESNWLDKNHPETWGLLCLANLGLYEKESQEKASCLLLERAEAALDQALVLRADSALLEKIARRFTEVDRPDISHNILVGIN